MDALLPLAFLATWAAVLIARWMQLVDVPGGRKTHDDAVPLAGGLALFLTLAVSYLLPGTPAYSDAAMAIIGFVFLLGVYDDARHINPWLRLVLHYFAGAAMAWFGGTIITNVGNLLALGDIPLLYLAVPLTALSFAGLSNAFNMIDGIDGLAAILGLLPLAMLFTMANSAELPMAAALLPVIAALLVFLLFNLTANSPWLPKIFLGDGGSVTLGFLVTASLVYFAQGEQAVIRPVTALWLVTVPLMDMLATMLVRIRRGKKLMEADRLHLHHRLLDRGLSPLVTLAMLTVYAVACALLGVALERIPPYLSLLTYFLLFLAHCAWALRASSGARRPRKDAS